jgi:hypothetical protein
MVSQAERIQVVEAPNQLVVLGAGAEHDAVLGVGYLRPASISRAERAASYYYENLCRFSASQALIVCSGGYEGKSGQEELPVSFREGPLMRDHLVGHCGLPSKIVEAEYTSTSTLTNLTSVLGLAAGSSEYIDPYSIGPDNPLGLVSHRNHLKRAVFFAAKLGLDKDSILEIAVNEDHDELHESFSRAIYKVALSSTNGVDDVLSRERHVVKPLIKAAVPVVKMLKRVKQ